MIEFKILGIPSPKQSARFYAKNIGGKHQQVAVNEVIGIFNKIYK